jgi:CheY-like chemotaxis protein
VLTDTDAPSGGDGPREFARRSGDMTARDFDVLVVDDDEDVRTSLSEILGTEGLTVEEAGNGKEAIRVLHSAQVGVVLLDLNMPVLDGFAVVDELDQPPPIVLLTGRQPDEELEKRRTKLAAFLQKPCRPQRLLSVVMTCLRGEAISDIGK